ncbi:MAG: hypothetical protein M0R05_03005 [Bacilli bacterium]|nr:hypothetical protein [Bacilli bacterium]MDD4076626.1 hypothetical protein [Bacilli bacterium]MDD4388167.1 hypothetical protein [Bacilli bacterium]
MLGKLFKHEFKNTYLEITIINISIIVMSVICALLFRLKTSVFLTLTIITLVFLLMGAFIMLFLNIVKSFNRKMFTNEGYLTFTLPVSVDNIIISKIITNIIWYFITAIVLVFSLFLILTINSDYTGVDFKIFKYFNLSHIPPLLIITVRTVIDLLLFLIFLLFTLSVLNIGKIHRYKTLVGFALYFGLSIVSSWIKNLFVVIPFGLYFSGNSYYIGRINNISNIVPFFNNAPLIDFNCLLWNLLMIIGLYILSRLMIIKKLELE